MGLPGPTLTQAIREEGATLVAMGTHGATASQEVACGRVTEHLLRTSPVPLLVAHPAEPAAEPAFRNLLVPLDGGRASLAALPCALEFARGLGSGIRLLHVLPAGAADDRARRWLESLSEAIAREGVPAVSALERGDPADAIVETLRTAQADVLALATHGLRCTAPEVPAGRVAERVLRRTGVPVLLVNPSLAAPDRLVGPPLEEFRAEA